MSVLNINSDDSVECPLCMEPLEMDDLSFFPCTCGYQICRFCWHRIRTDENGLCPACRKAYPENPADFKPLSTEEIQRIKAEKRQKDQQKKQKATENRKHLANVRVVQRNLVFVVGLSPKLADPEVLKRTEYFGKFGKIHKVVINHSTQYAGSQGPSASAYVTYIRGEDALRAIQSVNNIVVDGRTMRASLGTTKYCSHFMKNQICPKPDCMYLHEIGDDSASFTKEEMQQGKHTDYERMLLDQLYLLSNNKERRKPSTSPPLQGAQPGSQAVSKDAWPSLPPGNSSNSVNSSSKGSTAPAAIKTDTAAPTVLAAPKEKRGKSKGSAQPAATVATTEPSSNEEVKGTNVAGQSRKTKDKQKGASPPAEIASQPQTNHNRQRSSSRSPALSSSSNPTPPPLTSSSPSASSQDSCYAPLPHQSQIQILQQGACMAAEEEAIDRARDEAENYPPGREPDNSSLNSANFARTLMENSSNHSFFSTGPIAALSARTSGQSLAGCWLADGAEEGSFTSCLPHQSASDLQSVKHNANTTESSVSYLSKASDDDLGFDPFHETQKALAEMLEKESISAAATNFSNSSHLTYSNSSLYSTPAAHHSLARQSPALGMGLGLNLGVGLSANQPQQQPQQQPMRTRVPPPGFTPAQMGLPGMNQNSFGLSLPSMGLGLNGRQSGVGDYGGSKMLPFMNHSASNGSTGSSLGPRLFQDSSALNYGGSGFGMNYSMSMGNIGLMSNQPGPSTKNPGFGVGVNSGLPYMNNGSGSNLAGLSAGLGEPTPMKDWQDGLRGFFPSNNGSAMNATNRTAMGSFPPGMGSQPGNVGPSLQPALNKSWQSNVPDWSVIDPAIVTSGQLSDSRSDSPPHWLRSLEQLTESAPVQTGTTQSNLFGLPASHYYAPTLNRGPGTGLDTLGQSSSFWPTASLSASMPPPGFSHLRPPTKAAAADTHKLLDNL